MTTPVPARAPRIEYVWDLANRAGAANDLVVAVDSNVMIQLCDTGHSHHASARELFEKLALCSDLRVFYFVAQRLEVMEYFRRKSATEYLRQFYASGSDFGCPSFDTICRGLPELSPSAAPGEYLGDRMLKHLRAIFLSDFPVSASDPDKSRHYWKQLCAMSFSKCLPQALDKLDELGFIYASLHTNELFPKGAAPPKWDDLEKIMINFGMASNDASILNMMNASPLINGIISNDIDIIEFFRGSGARKGLRCFTFIKAWAG